MKIRFLIVSGKYQVINPLHLSEIVIDRDNNLYMQPAANVYISAITNARFPSFSLAVTQKSKENTRPEHGDKTEILKLLSIYVCIILNRYQA